MNTSTDRNMLRICLITGYLGAGKTTLLNHILTNREGIRAAVIVNDIGEINIDAELIAATGEVSEEDNSLIPLSNGCICCTLKSDLAEQLTELADAGIYDYIIIEASGICEPIPIAQTITMICNYNTEDGLPMCLDNITAVIDCARMKEEFENGRLLMRPGIGEDDIENLLISQIELCNTLILNKTDLVSENDLREIRALAKKLQRNAVICETTGCNVPLTEILNTGRFDLDRAVASAGWVHAISHPEDEEESEEELEYGIGTFVYVRRRPFVHAKLAAFCDYWPHEVIRCKGMVWYDDQRDRSYMFEQAGRQITEAPSGGFLASLPAEEQERVLGLHPELREMWDPKYGDRMIKLVFIGQHMNQNAITALLDMCLGD